AGIVDQDIRIRTGLQGGLAAGRRGDVAGDLGHGDAGMALADFGGGLRQRLRTARGQGDMHALDGQRDGAGASETLAGGAYDGPTAFDSKIHGFTPVMAAILQALRAATLANIKGPDKPPTRLARAQIVCIKATRV